jgi:hypothetical protein
MLGDVDRQERPEGGFPGGDERGKGRVEGLTALIAPGLNFAGEGWEFSSRGADFG